MDETSAQELIDKIRKLAQTYGLGEEFDRELAGASNPVTVRRNCAFCGRERSRKDDNHAPECSYWQFFY